MTHKKKILLVYTNYSTFVRTDYEILSGEFEVIRHPVLFGKGILNHFRGFLKQFIFLLFNCRKFDVYYIWFADSHSFLPVFFSNISGKKSLLVNGGYDVARITKYGYGVFCSRMRGFLAAKSMRNCTLNLPVSRFVARKVKAITHNEKYRVIYNCVNLSGKLPSIRPERKTVLTVGLIDSERDYKIKGIDTFAEVARLLPHIPFCVVGLNKDKLEHHVNLFPPNLQVIDSLPHEELIGLYLEAKIYCQLSRVESFGVALAEAVSYGCIPLITNEGAMPELVNDRQFQAKREINQIKEKIQFFYSGDEIQGLALLKERIEKEFSLNARAESILNAVHASWIA